MTEAERHGLKKGTLVIVVTSKRTGKRSLFLYETGASWYTEIGDEVTREYWDGQEKVSFYNGD